MIRLSVIDYFDGIEKGCTNYPNPVCVQVCGFDELLITYIDALGTLNTIRVDLDKQSIELYKA
jgi:hypothetical protein